MRVTTQAELDSALANSLVSEIDIVSPGGVWLAIRDSAGKYVRAFGSASVSASGSASVRAFGSASVRAFDSASVSASAYVAVHLHSSHATIQGDVLIDVTKIDRTTWAGWSDYNGVETVDGEAILYKAVDKNLKSGRGFAYPIGEHVEAPDWVPDGSCGGGLHFGPSPHHALAYFDTATRFLKVAVRLDELSIIDGKSTSTAKVKAKGCRVLAEVNVHGVEVAS